MAPSHSWIRLWMIDCGWTTTSICSYGVPNRWWASISSSPLFISVAESIVILPPIAQVGWASACSTVTFSSSSRLRPRNGPPEAVRISRSTVPGRSAASSWCSAECSESTGMIAAPVACASCGDELAADDQRLLVGERQIDPLAERRDRRHQPRRADDRVEHQVALALGDQPDDAVGPRQHLAARPRLARPRGRVGVGERDPPDAVAPGLLDQRLPRARGAQPDDRELGRARDDVERLARRSSRWSRGSRGGGAQRSV